MIPYSDVAAILAMLWTIFQQYQINKICSSCPYLPANKEKEKNKNKLAIAA